MLVPMFFDREYVSLLFNELDFDICHEVLNILLKISNAL